MPRGARALPAACVEILRRADLILHVGDFTSADVLGELRSFARTEGVYGNMDDAAVRAVVPERQIVEAAGLHIGLLHDPGPAAGRHERLLRDFVGCDVVAYGHTHLPEVARIGDTWIVNPGSPTERRRAPGHTMAVIDAGDPELVELD
jgi:putative phosphoesterase